MRLLIASTLLNYPAAFHMLLIVMLHSAFDVHRLVRLCRYRKEAGTLAKGMAQCKQGQSGVERVYGQGGGGEAIGYETSACEIHTFLRHKVGSSS